MMPVFYLSLGDINVHALCRSFSETISWKAPITWSSATGYVTFCEPLNLPGTMQITKPVL